MARSIESHGRDLWNLCLRLKRESAQTAPKLLIWARVFSFALLCLGRGSRWQKQDAESEVVYLMTQALTLARLCVAAGELDPATGALRKAAEFLDRLKKMSLGQSAKKGRLGLEANYHAMRIALVIYFSHPLVKHSMYSSSVKNKS